MWPKLLNHYKLYLYRNFSVRIVFILKLEIKTLRIFNKIKAVQHKFVFINLVLVGTYVFVPTQIYYYFSALSLLR